MPLPVFAHSNGTTPDCVSTLLAEMARVVAQILRADRAGLIELGDDGQSLRQTLWGLPAQEPSEPHVETLSRQAESSLAAHSLQAGRTVHSDDLAADSRFSDTLLNSLGLKSGLCVPVLFHDIPLCLLGAYREREEPFTPAEAQAAEKIAAQVAHLIGAIRGEEARLAALPNRASSGSEEQEPWQARRSPRHEYRFPQLIAPYEGEKLPERGDFYEVDCRDLSSGGIALYLSRPPMFETLVVALGRPPQLRYVTAKVARVEPIKEEGQDLYVVGCRFTGKVAL